MNIGTENKKIIPFEDKDKIEKSENESQINILTDFFNTIGSFIPEIQNVGLAEILSLPEEQFEIISQYFLEELEKSLNNGSNEKIQFSESLREAGLDSSDLNELFSNISSEIDSKLTNVFDSKRIAFLKQMFSVTFNALSDSEGISKRVINIPIEFKEGTKIPAYAKAGDAGMDIYALEDCEIDCGETKIIPTGIKVAIPKGYALLIQPRSGMSAKSKMRIANTPGLIDSGYRDEIGVIVENIDSRIKDIEYDFDENGVPIIKSILHGSPIHIEKGQRFAQMRLVEAPTAYFFRVDNVKAYEGDRHSGFGGTGDK